MKHNKLVRDNIPDIIIASGKLIKTHKASNGEYLEHLYLKLIEELMEFRSNPSDEEMADIYEVLQALEIYHNLDGDDIKKEQFSKRAIKGGFLNGIILEEIENKQDQEKI